MYCKHCGKQISDDSKFCQYCGGTQEVSNSLPSSGSKPDSPKKEKVIEIPTIKANLSNTTKWWICGSGLWVILNLVFLFSNHSSRPSDYFVPFEKFDIYYYDITEFLVYVLGLPFLIWGAKMLYKKYISKYM